MEVSARSQEVTVAFNFICECTCAWSIADLKTGFKSTSSFQGVLTNFKKGSRNWNKNSSGRPRLIVSCNSYVVAAAVEIWISKCFIHLQKKCVYPAHLGNGMC
jgi:hypothetical protein